MEVYLFDTNIASALFDKRNAEHSKALAFVQKAANAGDVVYISRIVEAEIEYGLALHTNLDTSRCQATRNAIKAFTMVKDIGKESVPHYATIRASLFRTFASQDAKGKIKKSNPEALVDKTTARELGIQENDLWMVAIAVEYNMTLVSEDKMRRLKQVYPALKFETWR